MASSVQQPRSMPTTPSLTHDEAEEKSLDLAKARTLSVVASTNSTSISSSYSTTPREDPFINSESLAKTTSKLDKDALQEASRCPRVVFTPSKALPTAQAKSSASTPARGRSIIPRNDSYSFLFKRGVPEPPGNRFKGKQSVSPSPVGSLRHKLSFGFAKSTTRHPSVASSMTASPEIRGMVKEESIPDLHEVNRKLEAAATQSYKKLLTKAMEERGRDNPEICRSHCLLIVGSPDADVETKVYAYNILATQASAGQAGHFLDESAKLVREHMRTSPHLEKLLGVIKLLRLDAEKEGKGYAGKGRIVDKRPEVAGMSGKNSEQTSGSSGMELEWPKPSFGGVADLGKVTPKTEQLLEWAGECEP